MQTVQKFYVIIACCEDISDRYCIQKSNNDHFNWMNKWMKSRGWEDNRRVLLQYILTCEQ